MAPSQMRQSVSAGQMAPAVLVATFTALLGSVLITGAHAQFGRGCADLGDALLNEACSEFVSYVKASNDYYYGRSNAELRAYMTQTPPPTAQCCSDATQFVSRGCSCNNVFVNYVAASRGYTAKTLAVVARAVQLSSCSASASIANPCDTEAPATVQAAPAQPRLIQVP